MVHGSDDSVVARAQAGDEEAFRALWRDVHPRLVRYLRVVAGADADDVAAQTWESVVRDLDRFQGDDDGFAGWVFTIARHRHLDGRRRAARHPQDLVGGDRLELLEAGDDPGEEAIARLGTEEALRLISGLAPDQAEVVALRTLGGLDVSEVAAVVGKRRGAVRVLAHRGLRRLAEELDAASPGGVRGVTR
jgi:RNA polymerase sigma-70 factor, ECF subfamily